MKRIALVTGAEGFIGSHMVKFLHAKGWNVIGSYLSEDSAAFPKLPNLRFTQCDLGNGQRVTQVLAQISAYAHISFRCAEPTHGVLGGSGRDLRV